MYWNVRNDEELVNDVFAYLDELNGMGSVNILDASLHIEVFFNLDPNESRTLVVSWLEMLRVRNDQVQNAKQPALNIC